MKDIIRNASLEAGFFTVGVSSAQPIDELGHLQHWLSKDFHGTMRWLARDPLARCDPGSVLPGAKSVICFGLAYGERGLTGKIPPLAPLKKGGRRDLNKARFARGPDYHEIVREKLARVWAAIKNHAPNAHYKICVDTSPIMEKALAVRAGLGWQGKHSIVIHPQKGSFFVLGEIITDLEIEPDLPISNQCNDCDKCMTACPTKALIEPYILNAGLCLSYLTIEHKGLIHPKLQKFIKPGQYGCDICQEACPYNKGVVKNAENLIFELVEKLNFPLFPITSRLASLARRIKNAFFTTPNKTAQG